MNVEPSQPFQQGHKRSPEVTAELIAALSKALIANPALRLGQLLAVVNVGRDPWLMWDEEWIEELNDFTS